MEFLLFNEVLKNLIFFPITYQKIWLYNANSIEQIRCSIESLGLLFNGYLIPDQEKLEL